MKNLLLAAFAVSVVVFSHSHVVATTVPTFDPSKYEAVFGDPNVFLDNFKADLTPKLDEYMGLGIAVSGFILVIRSLMH